MTTTRIGERTWSMKRDEEGYREYKLVTLVNSLITDGPFNVLSTPGLPLPGAIWNFFGDVDPFAWCHFDAEVNPVQRDNAPNKWWEVEHTFSTKPLKKCQDSKQENPLLDPPEISGDFETEKEELTHDAFGKPILNSAYEQMRGPTVEFKVARPKVVIKMNKAFVNLQLYNSMVNTVNNAPLWGLPPRCILFSDFKWEKKYYGQCFPYYELTLEFQVNNRTFDRWILDEGTKALRGHWETLNGRMRWILDRVGGALPENDNPAHMIRVTDSNGNLMRVILNGSGRPWDPAGWEECFFGTRTDAYAAMAERGATLIFGPFATQDDCVGTVNPYLPATPQLMASGLNPWFPIAPGEAIPPPDAPGPGENPLDPVNYWGITKVHNDPNLPPQETYCFHGTNAEAQANAESASSIDPTVITAFVSGGPFVTLTACEEFATGSSGTPAWWKITAGGQTPGSKFLVAYKASPFGLLSLPISF